jgi:phospholipid-binding lipoprotein MlaA
MMLTAPATSTIGHFRASRYLMTESFVQALCHIVSRLPSLRIRPPRTGRLSALACAAVLLSGCSTARPGTEINDPYEPVNRQVHAFNKGFDQAILDPAGEAVSYLPDIIKDGIVNFSDNAGLPNAAANSLLQGDVKGTVRNSLRFILNTTVGVLGFFDPAGRIGVVESDADFGETLAVWGIAEGAYLELPGLGPSTERDAVGIVVDFFFDPLQMFGVQPPLNDTTSELLETDTIAQVGEIIVERGKFDDTFDSVWESADSYAQLRLIYLQNRRYELSRTGPQAAGPADEDYYFDPYEDQQ